VACEGASFYFFLLTVVCDVSGVLRPLWGSSVTGFPKAFFLRYEMDGTPLLFVYPLDLLINHNPSQGFGLDPPVFVSAPVYGRNRRSDGGPRKVAYGFHHVSIKPLNIPKKPH
jgi:hypothetical protein